MTKQETDIKFDALMSISQVSSNDLCFACEYEEDKNLYIPNTLFWFYQGLRHWISRLLMLRLLQEQVRHTSRDTLRIYGSWRILLFECMVLLIDMSWVWSEYHKSNCFRRILRNLQRMYGLCLHLFLWKIGLVAVVLNEL